MSRAFVGEEPGVAPAGLTVDAYARIKALPPEWLRGELGLRDSELRGRPAVAIPYRDQDGNEIAVRYRVAMNGSQRLRWEQGTKAKGKVYALERRKRAVAEGFALLNEGESDTQTALYHGYPAFGIPGVGMFDDELTSPALDGIDRLIFIREPGEAAERLLEKLRRSRLSERIRVATLGEHKDISALHLALGGDREAFRAAVEAAIAAAEPLGPAKPQAGAAEEAEPPPLDISLAELLDLVVNFYRRYVVMSAEQADTCALWDAHTHVVDAFEYSPYLAHRSAEKRSGMTTALKAHELLVAKPWRVITPSEAVVFRKIDRDRPTLLLDEYDTIFAQRDHEPLRAILNAGNEPGTTVPRCAGANRDQLADFAIYCAKALAGIGPLPDTVADRTIAIELKRKRPGDSAARFRRREAREAAAPLRRTLAALLEPCLDELAEARPKLPEELDDRALDTWEPLLAIADLAGGDWPERARRAALSLSGAKAREDDSVGIVLLRDLHAIFEARGAERALASSAICEALHEIEESPWADWYGKPITVRGVAKILGRYHIKPKQLWVGGANVRGYERASFEDAWSRLLPDTQLYPLDPLERSNHAPSGPLKQPLGEAGLALAKQAANPHEQPVLADLADKSPDTGGGAAREQPEEALYSYGDIPF